MSHAAPNTATMSQSPMPSVVILNLYKCPDMESLKRPRSRPRSFKTSLYMRLEKVMQLQQLPQFALLTR